MSARRDLLAGARAISPLLLGVVPFAVVTGVTAVRAGISPLQAMGMSIGMYAGASQLAVIDLAGTGAPVAVMVLTAIVINLRFLMYSASIAPYFRRFPLASKSLGAYVLTDHSYAISVTEYRDTSPADRNRLWFYLGASVFMWFCWQVGTAVGIVAGAAVPGGLSLEFAIPLTFMALLFPAIEDGPTSLAALVAGGVAVLAAWVPFDLGLLVGAAVGIAAGVFYEYRTGRFPTTEEGPE